jgi:acetylornithine deacetylase/succinyl-diaminopimelate desuccinylase-like protein
MTMRHWKIGSGLTLATIAMLALTTGPSTATQRAAALDPRAGEAAFRETYRELVETNTVFGQGSCTLAAERMAARLRAAGFPDSDLHLVVPPGREREGNLVAVMPGSDASAPAMLLLAHIDVVAANRADWERDPFTLVEENGNFYARGSIDDKAQAAVWVDTLIRFRQEGFRPRRTIRMALTCGEETAEGALNGARYLVQEHRALIDAELALNEGGGGMMDANDRPLMVTLQVGEKLPQNFRLEVTNPGGHSSRPVRDNAITRLSRALIRVGEHDFPIEANAVTTNMFREMARFAPAPVNGLMTRFAANPADAQAGAALAAADPSFNALMRTTCVTTTITGGHAPNALPQRVSANVNCRVMPGTSTASIRDALIAVINDPQVSVTMLPARSDPSPAPPLNDRILAPARRAAQAVFPGTPLVPTMVAGGTDAAFLTPAGIPTYGITGFMTRIEGNSAHGLNEFIRVQSLMDGRAMLYLLVRDMASRR